MTFCNVYEDEERAAAYARLAYPGTYFLAYRDLPSLIETHTRGTMALDFGCGTGRSTRFLRDLGFRVTGIDIAAQMIARARALDSQGDYRLVPDGDLKGIENGGYDLILAAFTFDNIPTKRHKRGLLEQLRSKLKPGGRLLILVSAPEIYCHEWASFTTREFPRNRHAKDGDKVYTVMTDVNDHRPVEDILCTPACYRQLFEATGLREIECHRPLGRVDEPFAWKSETHVAPWYIYVLGIS